MIWAILAYLVTIILANVTVSISPIMVYVNALVFIGLDLTLKDKFQISLPWYKILGIILLGSFLTYLLNAAFLPIAIASTAAFSAAFLVDYIVFSLLKHNVWYRVMVSNVFGSFTDSFVFIYLAPFPFSWGFVLSVTALKIIGGVISGYILIKKGIIKA
jgi:hypothetical protein